MRHGSLFSGIGGFDLAAQWMGWENIFHCEWNQFCQRILKHYWPNAESFSDITKTDFKKYANKIDILTGGFPCQGFSTAGQRKGVDDHRYLWPEMLRAIREIQPLAVVGENVTGILSMGEREMFFRVDGRTITKIEDIDHYEAIYTRQVKMLVNGICEDLEKIGYSVQPFVIPAAGVGAPHRRDRVWFVAYSIGNGHKLRRLGKNRQEANKSEIDKKEWERLRGNIRRISNATIIANTNTFGFQRGPKQHGLFVEAQKRQTEILRSISANTDGIRLRGENNGFGKSGFVSKNGSPNDWQDFPTQSPVCSGDDGFSSGLDGITFSKWRNESIKAAGNAIVPQVALQIFKAIEQFEKLQ